MIDWRVVYRLNRLDEPVLMAVPKPMQTEFDIHHRLESCDHSPPFSSPFSQFWLGPLNILLLKDQTYFCFEVCLALNKLRCVRGMSRLNKRGFAKSRDRKK